MNERNTAPCPRVAVDVRSSSCGADDDLGAWLVHVRLGGVGRAARAESNRAVVTVLPRVAAVVAHAAERGRLDGVAALTAVAGKSAQDDHGTSQSHRARAARMRASS